MSTEIYYMFYTNYNVIHGNFNDVNRSFSVKSWPLEGLWPIGQKCQSRSLCAFLVEEESDDFYWGLKRLCDLLRFNIVYYIWMKSTEALWVVLGNLVLISFGACHCQYVPSCLGLAPRLIEISTICLFPSGLQPIRCIYHRANLTLPILHYWSWKHSVSQR